MLCKQVAFITMQQSQSEADTALDHERLDNVHSLNLSYFGSRLLRVAEASTASCNSGHVPCMQLAMFLAEVRSSFLHDQVHASRVKAYSIPLWLGTWSLATRMHPTDLWPSMPVTATERQAYRLCCKAAPAHVQGSCHACMRRASST